MALTMRISWVIVFLFYLCLEFCYCKQPQFQIYGILAAFGDFNSDKSTDLFVIGKKDHNYDGFRVYKANNKPEFTTSDDLRCPSPNNESIVGLIPGDFQGNALMDVVVVTKNNSHDSVFNLYLVTGNRSHLQCYPSLSKPPFAQVTNQPLALDYNGDMIVDLLAQDASDNQRYIYSQIKESSANKTLLNGTFVVNDEKTHIRSPNSNAFIDLDGDFRTDLFIETKSTFECWHHSSSSPAVYLNISIPVPLDSVVGMSTFADFNADGIVDLILPVCSDKNCNAPFLLSYDRPSNRWIIINDQFPNQNNSSPLVFYHANQGPEEPLKIPLKLRHADVDGDGFPDLIAVMVPQDKNARNWSAQKSNRVVVLHNIKNESNPLGRSFVPRWFIENTAFKPEKYAPVMATFFDLGEDGKSDVLITFKNIDTEKFVISAVYNEQMVDACFLKVLVTSGLCYSDCPSFDPASLDSPSMTVPYGTNQPGSAILYQLIDTEGNLRRGFAGQLSQSSDFSLQTPYTIFGLGQMPNFVDNLTASIPATFNNKLRMASWPQIVPDAQVVVIPYPPEYPNMWRTKLFITPSDIVISTLITLLCTCLLLLLIIILLHRKESLEDLAEHEEYKRHWPESR